MDEPRVSVTRQEGCIGMRAKRLPDGKLLVPFRVESEDRSLVGHGYMEIDSSHPEYEMWERSIRRREEIESSVKDAKQPVHQLVVK